MAVNYVVAGTVLVISALLMTGCTGPSPAPVAITAPAPVGTTAITVPAPAGIPPVTTTAAWTPETPATGRPYSKMYTFTATGDYDEHTFTTDRDRTWVFSLTYPDEGDFVVVIRDSHGAVMEVLAGAGGSSAGRKSVWLKAGSYSLDVKADAPWTITMFTG